MLKELGRFKNMIAPKLYTSENIRDIILGSDYTQKYTSQSTILKALKGNIYSHLFVDDTISATETYIFYDVYMPNIHSEIKSCNIIMYAFCHRDILDTYTKAGYEGNRADVLCQMIEEIMLDQQIIREFGIGKITLSNVSIYKDEKRFYGRVMEFSVPNFR